MPRLSAPGTFENPAPSDRLMTLRRRFLAAIALLALSACARPAPPTDPQYVAQWLRSSLSFVRSERGTDDEVS